MKVSPGPNVVVTTAISPADRRVLRFHKSCQHCSIVHDGVGYCDYWDRVVWPYDPVCVEFIPAESALLVDKSTKSSALGYAWRGAKLTAQGKQLPDYLNRIKAARVGSNVAHVLPTDLKSFAYAVNPFGIGEIAVGAGAAKVGFSRGRRSGRREMRNEMETPTNKISKRIIESDGGFKVVSESGKNLGGPYKSRPQAEKRLRQVEYFKHNKVMTGDIAKVRTTGQQLMSMYHRVASNVKQIPKFYGDVARTAVAPQRMMDPALQGAVGAAGGRARAVGRFMTQRGGWGEVQVGRTIMGRMKYLAEGSHKHLTKLVEMSKHPKANPNKISESAHKILEHVDRLGGKYIINGQEIAPYTPEIRDAIFGHYKKGNIPQLVGPSDPAVFASKLRRPTFPKEGRFAGAATNPQTRQAWLAHRAVERDIPTGYKLAPPIAAGIAGAGYLGYRKHRRDQ